jgi:HD superfamily phosphodiesterase
MNYEKCINQIIEFSERFYKSLDFAHNIEHGKRVVKNARTIAEIEGGNLFLIEAGSWLHQFHDNIDEVNNFIKTLDMENELKNKLCEIVKCRPQYINEESLLESKIVYDADAIEVLSSYGMIREIICNAKCRNKEWEKSVEDTINVQKRFKEKLQTKTAKEMLERDFEIIDNFWKSYKKWSES